MTQELKDAVKAWEKLSMENSNFGAADTEPDGVFQRCLRRTLNGEDCKIPASASDWQLYSGMAGSAKAARDLTRALRSCMQVINKTPHGQMDSVRKYLEDYIWRC